MIERLHQDRITIQHTEMDGEGNPQVVREELLMNIRRGLAGLRRQDMPEGVDELDLRGLSPDGNGSTIVIRGDAVNATIPLEGGEGSVPLGDNVNLVADLRVNQRALVADFRDRAARGISSLNSPSLATERGVTKEELEKAIAEVYPAPRISLKKRKK